MFEEQSNMFVNFGFPYNTQANENPQPITRKKLVNEKINSGRWKEGEHKKFLEAVILYGNDWKCVHRYIKSRSSTQAR